MWFYISCVINFTNACLPNEIINEIILCLACPSFILCVLHYGAVFLSLPLVPSISLSSSCLSSIFPSSVPFYFLWSLSLQICVCVYTNIQTTIFLHTCEYASNIHIVYSAYALLFINTKLYVLYIFEHQRREELC